MSCLCVAQSMVCLPAVIKCKQRVALHLLRKNCSRSSGRAEIKIDKLQTPDRPQGTQRRAGRPAPAVMRQVLGKTAAARKARKRRVKLSFANAANRSSSHTRTSKALCHCCCCQSNVACLWLRDVAASPSESDDAPLAALPLLLVLATCCLTSLSTACHTDMSSL